MLKNNHCDIFTVPILKRIIYEKINLQFNRDECSMNNVCKGCVETNGFNGFSCKMRKQLIQEINALNVKNIPKVTKLYAIKSFFVNLEYTLQSCLKIKFWNYNEIYLGAQLEKENIDTCFGITASEKYLLVCE